MKYLIALNVVLMLAIFIFNGQPRQEETQLVEDEALEVTKTNIDTDDYPVDLATIEIVLQKQYLDGRMDTETVQETISAMEDLWITYENYQLIDQRVGQMVFREYIDDISPYLKEIGYFGIGDEQLVIYEREPEYKQSIQVMYDLDLDLLTDEEKAELNKGIKIDSKETYQEVIDVFRQQIPSKKVHGESD